MSAHDTHDAHVVGHEETDAEVAPLLRFAIFLTVFTVLTAALTVGFYKYLDSREMAEKAPRFPLAAGVERPVPPSPRLQTYPFDDVKGFRKEEAKLLEHYQWINKNDGTVRIPIERAMDLLAERGLPHRAGPVAAVPAPSAPAPAQAPAH
jgi:hypothetical protein